MGLPSKKRTRSTSEPSQAIVPDEEAADGSQKEADAKFIVMSLLEQDAALVGDLVTIVKEGVLRETISHGMVHVHQSKRVESPPIGRAITVKGLAVWQLDEILTDFEPEIFIGKTLSALFKQDKVNLCVFALNLLDDAARLPVLAPQERTMQKLLEITKSHYNMRGQRLSKYVFHDRTTWGYFRLSQEHVCLNLKGAFYDQAALTVFDANQGKELVNNHMQDAMISQTNGFRLACRDLFLPLEDRVFLFPPPVAHLAWPMCEEEWGHSSSSERT